MSPEEIELMAGLNQGIELMETIYSTYGSNEPLRYSSQ